MPHRTLFAALVGPALGAAAIVPAVVWWGRLPDPMATQWTLGGAPDGALVRGAAVALVLGVAVVSGLSSSALALLGSAGAGVLAGVSAVSSWLAWYVIVANQGAPTWHEAARLSLPGTVPAVALGVAVAVAVTRCIEEPGERAVAGGVVLPAAAHEEPAWVDAADDGRLRRHRWLHRA